MTDKELAKIVLAKRPIACEECGGKIKYLGGGEYECMNCKHVFLDDFGKVRKYLYENGSTKSSVIAAATGVPEELIMEFVRDGKIEFIENAGIKLRCDRCGCVIRRGRICAECAKKDVENFGKSYNELIRNEYNEKAEEAETEKIDRPHMRYFNKDRKL